MSAEKCLSKEARKVWGEEQDVHDTGSEFQSAMHEGKKDRNLLLVLHTDSLAEGILSECLRCSLRNMRR